MKSSLRILSRTASVGMMALAAVMFSCNKIPSETAQGTLSWNFSQRMLTRATVDLPDTDAFILTVKNSAGDVLYEGAYGNSGLRMRLDSEFGATYPNGSVTVSSAEGNLKYSQTENRIGYFKAGNVSVSLDDGTTSKILLTRYLEACEVLTLGISCPAIEPPKPDAGNGISITVDTSRVWSSYDYEIGSGQGADPGTTVSTAYSVAQAKEHIGEKSVWVCGYIVGGDLSSAKEGISFTPPFTSMTCLAIASRSSVTSKSSCMSVKLPKGDIRTEINLADNPGLIGRKIYLKGDLIAAYFGIPGIENITEYVLK